MTEKIIKVSRRDIDARPTISISTNQYKLVLEKLRKQAKEERRRLITKNGIEDYTVEDVEKTISELKKLRELFAQESTYSHWKDKDPEYWWKKILKWTDEAILNTKLGE